MTPGGGSLHFLVGPGIALVALVLLLLMCRWVFGTGRRSTPPLRRVAPVVAPADAYGLLVPVAASPDRDAAEDVRRVLRDSGIRGTVVPTSAGHEVCVFPGDAAAARALVDAR